MRSFAAFLGGVFFGLPFFVLPMHAEVLEIPAACRQEIAAAEMFVWMPRTPPRAAIALCPGQNGSSRDSLSDPAWRKFAERESFALVGMRFVSRDEDLREGRGYFVAERGAGEIFKRGLEKFGLARVPLCLYGFSGGAHFAMSYAAWTPKEVSAFCAYSFAWWTAPPPELTCPALVVCGQSDGGRYGASYEYYQTGRKAGKPWAWASLRDVSHEESSELDSFVRVYFAGVLNCSSKADERVAFDNMTEKAVSYGKAVSDVGTSVLPNKVLAVEWQSLHHP
jgi:hypothetical protein